MKYTVKAINKKFKNKFIFFYSLFLLLYCKAEVSAGFLKSPQEITNQEMAFNKTAGFGTTATVSGVIATAIEAFLGVLGITFIILIILAGYNWMTAGGNEDKVTKAKDTIKRAIIGLIITVSAYAITVFVFSEAGKTTTGPV